MSLRKPSISYTHLLLLIKQYTIVPFTAAIMRQHPAVIIIALPAAAEQSQSVKSGKKTTHKIFKITNISLVYLFPFCVSFFSFHLPTTVNSWFTVWLCPVAVFTALQLYVPLSELRLDCMMYTASWPLVGFSLKSQVNCADGTHIAVQ